MEWIHNWLFFKPGQAYPPRLLQWKIIWKMKPLVVAATWVSNSNLLPCMKMHQNLCLHGIKAVCLKYMYSTTCFNMLSNIHCYNMRYTAKKKIFIRLEYEQMYIVGKQSISFMAMVLPSHFKKNSKVSAFPKKLILYAIFCQNNKWNKFLSHWRSDIQCTLYNVVQSHVNKFFLLYYYHYYYYYFSSCCISFDSTC